MTDPQQPQPENSRGANVRATEDLDLPREDADRVLGGDAPPPREVGSGMATGQRMHKPTAP